MLPQLPGLLTQDDVLGLLRCHRSTLNRMIAKGLFPAGEQIEGLGLRWFVEDVAHYLTSIRRRPRSQKPSGKGE